MIHHRTAKEVRRFDLFKLIVLIILIILLLFFWFSCSAETPPAVTESGPATATTQVTEPEPEAEDEQVESEPEIIPPTIDPLPAEALSSGEAVTLTGAGEPGSEVEIVVNGEPVGTATVDSDGKWRFALPALEPGDYQVSVRSLDSDGQVLAESESLSLTIPEPEMAAPTLNLLPDFSGLSAGDEAVISGTGEPGSEVEIVVDGQAVGTATVDSDGNWQFTLPALEPGDHTISARSLDADGQPLAESETSSFIWPDFSPTPPSLKLPDFSALSAGDEAVVGGTGEPGSEVEIVIDGQAIGTATVDSDGNWRFTLPALEPGNHTISVRSLDADGQPLAESETSSFIWPDFSAVSAPTIDSPTSGAQISGETTLSGTGQPDSQVEIVVDGKVAGTAPVDSDGNWTFDLTLVDPGTYLISVRAAEVTGLQPASEPVVVTVPEGVDGLLDIIFPADEADILVGELTVSGPGPSGGEVEVLDGETVLGSTQVGNDDEWHFTFEAVKGRLQLAARPAGSQASPTDFVDVRVVEVSDSYNCASNPALKREATYLVGTCDTLNMIARQAGVALADLIAANPQIDNQDLIYPGEVIDIPGQ